MAANPAEKILRYIRDLAEAEATKGLSDGQLLVLFTQHREQGAFTALVKRHGRLVWGVCRHILGTEQDAEDAFQATFLVLARRSGSIRKTEAVGSWLHGVAYRVAMKAMKRSRKRQAHERRAPATSAAKVPSDPALRELQALLDEEVRRLPEKYRAPFVLCCLEGRTREQVSKELGSNEGTVSSRIARARLLLQQRLTRRGVTLAAALCANDLWTGTVAACVPRALAGSTIKAACAAAGGTGFVGASVGAVALAEGVMGAMALAKWHVGAVLFLAVSVTVTTAALWGRQTPDASAPDSKPAEVVMPAIVVKKDLYGDTLPQGAVARLGTLRQRAPGSQLAITPDGKEIVTLDRDLTVRHFDALTGNLRAARQIKAPGTWLSKLSPRGTFALAEPRGQLELWDVAKGMRVQTLPLGDGSIWEVNSMVFSPDESQVAFADQTPDSSTRRVVLWDLKTSKSKVLWSLEKQIPSNDAFPVVAIAPDGKRVIACHSDRVLRCWEIEGYKLLWESKNQTSGLMFFSPDSQTVISTSRGYAGRIYRWEAATGTPSEEKYQPPKSAEYPVGFSPDGRFMAFEDGFEGMVLWKPGEAKNAFRLPPPAPRMRSGHVSFRKLPNNFVFTPDGKGVVRRQGPLQRWDLDTGEPVYAQTESWGHMDQVKKLAFSPDGRHLASCADDETIRIWHVATGRMLHIFPREGSSDRLAFTPDGKSFLALADLGDYRKRGVRQWDITTGLLKRDFKLPEPKPGGDIYYSADTDLRVTPDAKRILLLNWTDFDSPESILTTWEAATGTLVAQKPVARSAHSVLTPDGSSVLTLDDRAEDVRLLDIDSGKPRWTFQTDRVKDPQVSLWGRDLTLAPSGTLMAARSELRNQQHRLLGYDDVRIGDMNTGRQVAKLPVVESAAFSFSADDRVFAVATANSVRLWETASWQELGSIKTTNENDLALGQIRSLAHSPDGRTLATGHADSTIMLWDATLRSSAHGGKLTAEEANGLWNDLASADAPRAYAAIWRLVDDPQRAIPLLKERLKATLAPSPDVLRPLLSDLDNDQFQKREAAKQKLQVLGELAEPTLRTALKGNPSLEMQRRLEALLERLQASGPLKGEALRGIRAVQILERIGTPGARSVLQSLDQGLESASLTRAAKASLARMATRY